MANEPKKELTITCTFDAPRELVWKAWIDPKIVTKWWGPRGVTTPTCEVDARKGGKINIVMLAGKEMGNFAGEEWPMTGTFEEVSPQDRLVYIANALDDRSKTLLETRTTVTFDEMKGKTKLTVHILLIKSSDTAQAKFAIQGMEAGWTQSLDKLAELVKSEGRNGLKKGGSQRAESASQLIDARIQELGDWRGEMLSHLRALIKQADPDVVEEWKWGGVPVWSHSGLICTGETYKNVVKMTFSKGASLKDPSGLFNSSLEGNTRRAIDFHEGDKVDGEALKALVRAAVALNISSRRV